MKTHGEKRVCAILEVFHVAHTLVAGMGTQEHLLVRIVPRLIDRVEQWIGRALQRPGVPSRAGNPHRVRPAALGANPHRRLATGLRAGGDAAGHRRPADERSASRTQHGADPCPRLPVAQRDQRHHDGPLADGASPGPRTPREVCGRDGRIRTARPICGNSTPPSSYSIPAAAAARLDRWNTPSIPSRKRTGCWKSLVQKCFDFARQFRLSPNESESEAGQSFAAVTPPHTPCGGCCGGLLADHTRPPGELQNPPKRHSERSEESPGPGQVLAAMAPQILRCAQNDVFCSE